MKAAPTAGSGKPGVICCNGDVAALSCAVAVGALGPAGAQAQQVAGLDADPGRKGPEARAVKGLDVALADG